MLTLSDGSRYELRPDAIHCTDATGCAYTRSVEQWPWLLERLAAWPDATPQDGYRIHYEAKCHAVGQERAERVYVTSHGIIGTDVRVYAAWLALDRPTHYGRHGVVSSLGTGHMWAQLGSDYASAAVERLPAMSQERRQAATVERQRVEAAAHAVILTSPRHRPAIARHGYRRDMGRITVDTGIALPL